MIEPGDHLIWHQYNHSQKRMAVDISFTDGTNLRDLNLKDQNNVCVHPACRGVYPTNTWMQFSVNLTPVAGKRIKEMMIAYDNGASGATGVFRGYFDNVQVIGAAP